MKMRCRVSILRINQRMSPSSHCIVYAVLRESTSELQECVYIVLEGTTYTYFQTRQKDVRCGVFLNFRNGFIRKEEAERLLWRDLSERDQLQYDLAQVDAGALLFGIVRIRHVMLLRDQEIFLL